MIIGYTALTIPQFHLETPLNNCYIIGGWSSVNYEYCISECALARASKIDRLIDIECDWFFIGLTTSFDDTASRLRDILRLCGVVLLAKRHVL